MWKKIKDWWILITAAVVGILDTGLDAVNPLLEGAGLSPRVVDIVKYIFMLWGFYKAIKSTTEANKVKISQQAVTDYADDGPGKVVPPGGPEPEKD